MIEQRLAKLKAEREQLIANLNAYNGAIQDCEYWLKLTEEDEGMPNGPEITE
ncbi:MAG: hypothetical protein JRD89_04110 [Deltaproteobacteria bacterium]|nr:hypothetical protein [Deltaproteobacteria bacterium]